MKSSMSPITVTQTHEIPSNPRDFYEGLVTRNHHFVSEATQQALKNLKVLVAGCGSGGGACIEPLARLGVTHFRLVDNGSYELSNLNRQHAFTDSIGINKATFHRHEVLRINPFIDVVDFPSGILESNCSELVKWADIVLDCVDVTNPDSIKMKFLLHEIAKENKKPTLSPLDVGFCQWGMTFDYRNPKVKALNGRLGECRKAKHPIKALFTMYPLSCVPPHCLPLLEEVLVATNISASQIGCASDVLSGIVAAAAVRFANSGELIEGWNINLDTMALTLNDRIRFALKGVGLRLKIAKLLRALP